MNSGRVWQVLILLLAGCGGGQVQGENSQSPWVPDPRPLAKTLVYECPDEYEFVARVGPGEMAVWLEGRYLVLSRVRSASGAKYQEGDVVFWLKGDEALLSDGEQQHRNCLLVPARAPWEDARRRGVAFRAVGTEPGWHLEISAELLDPRQCLVGFASPAQSFGVAENASTGSGTRKL